MLPGASASMMPSTSGPRFLPSAKRPKPADAPTMALGRNACARMVFTSSVASLMYETASSTSGSAALSLSTSEVMSLVLAV